jgi:phosphatidylserine/phosphatidylglycerophosphate/cardiolipin synthase-like enzyme
MSGWSLVLNSEHFDTVVLNGMRKARRTIVIATANLTNLWAGDRQLFPALADLAEQGVTVGILHSSELKGRVLTALRSLRPGLVHTRLCRRNHMKIVAIDGAAMYVGSANLTGAGLGAKHEETRNFEAGAWVTDREAIRRVLDLYDRIWSGRECPGCGWMDKCEGYRP